MIHDTAAKIDEILRNGGEFWIIEVHGGDCDPEPRVMYRDTDRYRTDIELATERMRRPDLKWVPKKVTVVTEIEEP